MKSILPFLLVIGAALFAWKSGILMGSVDPNAAGDIAGNVDPVSAADQLADYATSNWMLTIGWPVGAVTLFIFWIQKKLGWAVLAALALAGILLWTLSH